VQDLLTYREAYSVLSCLSPFLQQLATLFLLFALVDVAMGILYCWDVMRKPRPIVQWVTYGFGILEAVFALAILIKFSAWAVAADAATSSDNLPDRSQIMQFRRLQAAFNVLRFIASLATLGLSIFVAVLASKRPDHRQVCHWHLNS
jgi:hypothetical protein